MHGVKTLVLRSLPRRRCPAAVSRWRYKVNLSTADAVRASAVQWILVEQLCDDISIDTRRIPAAAEVQ